MEHSVHRTLALLAALALIALAVACGGGGGGGSVPVSPEPSFDGLALVYSSDADRLALHWVEATDNNTLASEIQYHVYVGLENTVAGLYNATNLVSTVTNATSYTATGLTNATAYNALVVAEDKDGNRNTNHQIVEATTQAATVALAATPGVVNASSATFTGADAYTIAGAESAGLSVGDVLVIGNATGAPALKRVLSVGANGGDAAITTTDAALNELIDEGEISASFVLLDPSLVSSASSVSASALGDGYEVRQYDDPGGAFSITSVAPEPTRSASAVGYSNYRYSTYLLGTDYDSQRVRLGYTVDFVPRLNAYAMFESGLLTDRLQRARIDMAGDFSLDALLGYYLNSAYTKDLSKTLMSRTYSFKYMVGSVPVYQEVELSIKSELKLEASSAVAIETALKATKHLRFGFEWTRSGGWKPVKESGFTRSTTFVIKANGQVVATLRVYPEIKTSFYQAAESSVAFVPVLKLSAAAKTSPRVELTQFEAGFWAYLTASARLDVLDYNLPPWDLLEENVVPYAYLHTLPTASISCGTNSLTVGDTDTCSLTVTDGVNNAVPKENISWGASPAGCATFALSSDRRTATVTAAREGACEVVAAAYGSGVLGSVGTRYATSAYTIDPVPASGGTSATIPDGYGFVISSGAVTTSGTVDILYSNGWLLHYGGSFDANGWGAYAIKRVATNSTLDAVTSCPTTYQSNEYMSQNIAVGNVFCARSAYSGKFIQFQVTGVSVGAISFDYVTSSSSSF